MSFMITFGCENQVVAVACIGIRLGARHVQHTGAT
jgi:hypothetical protein